MRSERWRVTLDELVAAAQCDGAAIDRWLALGVMGGRFKEARAGGFATHITKPAFRRAVVMGRLVQAGFREEDAARAVEAWSNSGVFTLRADDIPLVLEYVSPDGTVVCRVRTDGIE